LKPGQRAAPRRSGRGPYRRKTATSRTRPPRSTSQRCASCASSRYRNTFRSPVARANTGLRTLTPRKLQLLGGPLIHLHRYLHARRIGQSRPTTHPSRRAHGVRSFPLLEPPDASTDRHCDRHHVHPDRRSARPECPGRCVLVSNSAAPRLRISWWPRCGHPITSFNHSVALR
jgi:hypothetical protein